MAAPHASRGWRIIARFFLRSEGRIRNSKRLDPWAVRHQGSAHRDAHAVEEVSARDVSVHAQFKIVGGIHWKRIAFVAHDDESVQLTAGRNIPLPAIGPRIG